MVRGAYVALLMSTVAVMAGCAAPRAVPRDVPTWCANRSSAVVFGDSMSTGWGLPDYTGNGAYAETAGSWTTEVAGLAADEWGTATTVVAHNGALASDFLPGGRWKETTRAVGRVHDLMPSLTVVALGANAYTHDVEPARFRERYRKLINGVQQASPRSTLLLVVQHEVGARAVEDPVHEWESYTGVIETVASAEGAEVLDLRRHLPTGGSRAGEGLFLPDKAHLTKAGHRVVRTAVWAYLSTWCTGAAA